MRRPRGFTIVTALILLLVGGGLFWGLTYGGAYWDNVEVKSILGQAANLAYAERNDKAIRDFVFLRLHQKFDVDVLEGGKTTKELSIEAPEESLRVERTTSPQQIDIWFTYSRDVRQPLTGQIKTITFNHHAAQDLSPTKW